MSFSRMQLLWLLALVPVLLAFLLARERTRTRVARRFATERLRGATLPARVLRPWLIAAGVALALLALAGPYAGYTLVPIIAREANRVFAIDVSNSMAAEDVGTSRLSAAKAIAARLAEEQEGRVALIVFEASPEVVSPLTTDSAAVISLIDTIVPGEIGVPGSDLGSAIIAALRLIESDTVRKADIVVLSDGEDQAARASEAIRQAKARGVEVSTIMIGSGEGSTIPTTNGPMRDSSGDVVTTHARSEILTEIAAGTGGTFLENPFAERALDALLGKAGAATNRETQARVPMDRYQWPLAFALALVFAGSLLNRGAE
ncbi:MAG TPA: VWA domain-containing protein [Thermoanaerobaculia bacterium]|nr:VWA domain-containing protein [Thermoanaerobaculia bacterium]